ncbi:uncharacterized protein LOC135691567 isoform X2 [Rhopilema esculentum]|eukprot:gene9408-17119_t
MAKEKPTNYSKSVRLLLEDGIKNHSKKICLCGFSLQEAPYLVFEDPFHRCLQHLDLSNNMLLSLNTQIGLLENLAILILSGNQLMQIPNEIGFLRRLMMLDLSRNCLKIIPKDINNLKELETVNLSGNQLSVVPEYLLRLPKLQKVFFIRNPYLENIPREIASKGLEAMRDYLGIKVEKYEVVSEIKVVDNTFKNECPRMISEIEKDWILENEQYVKKMKNACTQLDEQECDEIISKHHVSQSQLERSASTQTEPDEDGLLLENIEHEKKSIHESFTKKPINGDFCVKRNQNRKCSNINDAIENLVKIFRHQIHLISESKGSFPPEELKTIPLAKNCFGHIDLSSGILSPSRKPGASCQCCGLTKRRLSTSEYGSMSAYSQQHESSFIFNQDDHSCDGTDGSQHSDNFSDMDDDISDTEWLSSSTSDLDFWSSSQHVYINACKEVVIQQYGITLKIPHVNLSGHEQAEFSFQVISDPEFSPELTNNMQLATPIVYAKPHGAKFYSSAQATVELPLNIVIENGMTLQCFVSDTNIDDSPNWEEISSDEFDFSHNMVRIRTTHFSLFCAMASKYYASAKQHILASNGGDLTIDEVSGLNVQFSAKSLSSDIEASITVLFDDSQYKPDNIEKPLASPIVVLGPNGTYFEDDVEITLPLPGADKVFEAIEDPQLIILESQTDLSEKPSWSELITPYQLSSIDGVHTVTFRVKHFTVFTAAWDGLASAVATVTRIIPWFSHLVYFQALMSDCHHNNQFGLCIFCHLAGNPPVTDCYQFPIEVGRSKPRKLKKGDIIIQLRSSLFKADEDVGESENGLEKIEVFNGYDFDKQFALRFNEYFKEGIFGKVNISTKASDDVKKEVVEFVLQKSSQKRRKLDDKIPTKLETAAVQEIAGLLSIEDRWKELALALGYTRREISTKFDADNPIKEILTDFMARGGDADEFIKAMYNVARRLKLIPYEQIMENRENKRMEIRHEESRSSRYCRCPPTPEETPIRNAKRKLDVSCHDDIQLTDAKLDKIARQIVSTWKSVGRNLSVDERKLSEIDQSNQNESAREKAFQMLMAWKEMFPDEFCAEVLGRALVKCDLKYTARQYLSY